MQRNRIMHQFGLRVMSFVMACFILFIGTAGFNTAFAKDYDYDFYDVSVEGRMGVFNTSNETYLREEDAEDPELDEDEFCALDWLNTDLHAEFRSIDDLRCIY